MHDPTNPRQNGESRWPPPFAETSAGLAMLMGEVRSDVRHIINKQSDHDRLFQAGERRMDRIETSVSALASKASSSDQAITGWERALKRPAPWLIVLAALWWTGKLEIVLRFLEAIAKIAEHT